MWITFCLCLWEMNAIVFVSEVHTFLTEIGDYYLSFIRT